MHVKQLPSRHIAIAVLGSLLVAGSSATAAASEWEIDPGHSTAQFSVRHMMVSNVRGEFQKMSGTVSLDEKAPEKSMIQITIDASTINTRNEKRDGHLKSEEFFDAAKHPNITFKSTKIEKAGKGAFKVTGDLTMRGVTKPVTLKVEGPTPAHKSPFGQSVRGVSATGKVNRKDFGLNWNKTLEAGGVLVGDEVTLQIDAELVSKEPAPAAAK